MAVADTAESAARIYNGRLSRMTPESRINLAASLWHAADSVERAAIRRDYPGIDDRELLFRLAEKRFGTSLARRAYGQA
jgi:putative heme iron utilization protein